MPTFKVRLADEPTAVMGDLADGPKSWGELQDRGATSSDMNVLRSLNFIERDVTTGCWHLTAEGRGAMRPAMNEREV